MNFDLNSGQQEVEEQVAKFADREAAPYAAAWKREARFSVDVPDS